MEIGRGTKDQKKQRVKDFVKSLMDDEHSWAAMQKDLREKKLKN